MADQVRHVRAPATVREDVECWDRSHGSKLLQGDSIGYRDFFDHDSQPHDHSIGASPFESFINVVLGFERFRVQVAGWSSHGLASFHADISS